jgi:hypothetical protein
LHTQLLCVAQIRHDMGIYRSCPWTGTLLI